MYGVPKEKLTEADKQRIRNRYANKREEFLLLPAEELKKLLDTKMSRTDKYALEIVIDEKIKANIAAQMESQSVEESVANENIIPEQDANTNDTINQA